MPFMPVNDRLIQTRVPAAVKKKIDQQAAASGASTATWLRQLVIKEMKGRKAVPKVIPTGVHAFDKVTGGGLVPGRSYILFGSRGVGLTTLALPICDGFAREGRRALFASGEMTYEAILEWCVRLGIENRHVPILSDTRRLEIEEVIAAARAVKLVVVDSVNVCASTSCARDIGTQEQSIAVAARLVAWAKATNGVAILLAHTIPDTFGEGLPLDLFDVAARLERGEDGQRTLRLVTSASLTMTTEGFR